MNFFERQEAGRRNSKVLIALFACGVLATVAAVDIVGVGTWLVWQGRILAGPAGFLATIGHAPLPLHFVIVAATLAVIGGGSFIRLGQLRAEGGAGVARLMGARAVRRDTQDILEKRLLNVVDEMAIASGTRVPQVFVMDGEAGINAFAAGYDSSSAAIVVTRGTLEKLSRDELQGVVGHEFSHIVNGDMALNLHIVGILAGIVFIGAGGKMMMQLASKSKEKRLGAFVLLGFLLWVVGSFGVLCSRIIKSMLSREREYLADAGSVQFTRNPEGLAGALDQIRASGGSLVPNRHSEEISHLFFATGHRANEWLFATHPPIARRIERIVPRFQPETYRRRRMVAAEPQPAAPRDDRAPAAEKALPWGFSPAQAVALVGAVQEQHLIEAQAFVGSIPPALREALAAWPAAAGVVAALTLSRDPEREAAQAGAIAAQAPRWLADAMQAARPLVRDVAPDMHLAIVDLALPAMVNAGADEKAALSRALDVLLAAGGAVSLYRFAFTTFVRSRLEARTGAPARAVKTLGELRDAAARLISLVAHAGCGESQSAEQDFVRAFNVGMIESGLVGQAGATPRELCTPEVTSAALEQLRELAPLQKARLVKGLFAAITADGVIRPLEAALMRMVGGVLDCPLPPLMVPGVDASRPAAFSPTTIAA